MTSAITTPQTASGRIAGRSPCFLLVALGWLLSGYLLRLLMSMNAGRPPELLYCAACGETLASPSARLWNLPLAGWGLVYFAAIGLLLAVGTRTALRLAIMAAGIGVGVSVRLVFGLYSSVIPVCLLCVMVHLVNAMLFALLLRASRPASGLKIALSLIMAAAWLASVALLPNSFDANRLLAAYQTAPKLEIPPNGLDPVLGPENAKVRLVVFSSFRCAACKWFNGVVHRLRRQFGDGISVTSKHFPLSRECNPTLLTDMQPRACAAAVAAESANRQGLFWIYNDGLYASSLTASEPVLEEIARTAGLNVPRWHAERESELVQAKVGADVELGARLRVDATPTVFLNGRRVKDISLSSLAILIRHELAAAH